MQKPDTWEQEILSFDRAKHSLPDIARAMAARYPGLFAGKDIHQAVDMIRKPIRKRGEQQKQEAVMNVQEMLMDSLKKGTTSEALADRLGVTERIASVMIDEKKQAGYNVREVGGTWKILNDIIPSENHYENEWNGDKIIRFGLMGDTQINSKYTQITHLNKLYDFYSREGINVVYHTGDIDEGEQMRKGHQYELYNQGVDDHKEEIVRIYPVRDGVETRFITGNHDASMIKLAGVDIGRMIAADRADMKYLGQDSAVIHLTENCNLELCHPGDGTAYAMSYKVQKRIEAMSGGEKPNVLAIGHYHKAEYIPEYRNVHAFQTGCLQAQTPFMRGKGIAAMIGGWIVELHLNVDGAIESVTSSFRSFYTAIKDDWKNWR